MRIRLEVQDGDNKHDITWTVPEDFDIYNEKKTRPVFKIMWSRLLLNLGNARILEIIKE